MQNHGLRHVGGHTFEGIVEKLDRKNLPYVVVSLPDKPDYACNPYFRVSRIVIPQDRYDEFRKIFGEGKKQVSRNFYYGQYEIDSDSFDMRQLHGTFTFDRGHLLERIEVIRRPNFEAWQGDDDG